MLNYLGMYITDFRQCVEHFLFYSATEKILSKARQIVDIKKDDGFAALHLAALNGHKEVAHALINVVSTNIRAIELENVILGNIQVRVGACYNICGLGFQGRADVEIRNNRQQTPLLLAVSQGHIPLILLLTEEGGKLYFNHNLICII